MMWVFEEQGREDTKEKSRHHKPLCYRKPQVRVKVISNLLVQLRTVVTVTVNSKLYEYDI